MENQKQEQEAQGVAFWMQFFKGPSMHEPSESVHSYIENGVRVYDVDHTFSATETDTTPEWVDHQPELNKIAEDLAFQLHVHNHFINPSNPIELDDVTRFLKVDFENPHNLDY